MYNGLSSSCFNIAITIARQREQTSLLSTLKNFVANHLPMHQTILYNVVGKDPVEVRQYGHDENISIDNDAQLAQCYSSQGAISDTSEDSQQRYIFPVHGVGHIKHLVDIQGAKLDEGEYQTLLKLLTLFNSQYLLLDKNDHDALTGLLNRGAFEERLSQIILSHQHNAREVNHRYYFALFDIDHFKQVNDTYGHLYGDEVLILFTGIMEKIFRHEDMLFRYGGEEFAVVLNNVDLETASKILSRFRDKVAAYNFQKVGQVTVSIGFTAITPQTNTTDLIARADKALYYSKLSGRNQVNAYETLLLQGDITPTTRNSDDSRPF
jgi:diguanylate cyclase (GGDEF)-like protein